MPADSRPHLRIVAAIVLALALVAAACGGDAEDTADADPSASASGSSSASASADEPVSEPEEDAAPAEGDGAADAEDPAADEEATTEQDQAEQDQVEPLADPEPIELGRVIALGEDSLLADLLALGVTPILSSTNGSDGFVGIERSTEGIEPIPSFQLNAEILAAADPDMLITTQSFVDLAGDDDGLLAQLAPASIILQEDGWQERVAELGEALGVPERAEALLAQYDAAIAASQGALDPALVVSVATVYDFALAAWVDAPAAVPATLLDLGVTVSPGGGELANESFGRVRPLSDEQLPLLDGDLLVLLQNPRLESEDAALEAANEQPLWQSIPAVDAGNVVVLDRIGYQGVEGRIRLIDDLIAAIDGLG
ncbi:MAG: ABC transporter substrate-binding protein [Actinomycetota bacterium]